ncbi:maleylacetoacetate isomerase [Brumicola nitratireducens]|uniref:Maleylacetoacetate isomerase n=1 Tax=Glaciecola nitratireducens (strain JCM 12485 / KCTC 12276 / FR1064) TaxID=1085623 RepID=G4QLS0_GLANF|nr:maleylacetoacetate isomerase [Glaciecola nitratireducens]AEP30410.1 maleylacetoacetate isomerase [Glaciecola nitratireducens FR1064]
MSLKLYGYWRSSASYRVRIAMHLKQIDFDYVPVHLVKDGGEQRSAAYSSMNPSMLVPTFVDEDEDIVLNQSLAIMEYLDDKYPNTPALLPSHTLDKARVRALAQDIACDIQPVTNLRILEGLKSDFSASSEQTQAWCSKWITQGFTALEKRLATRSGKYCYGYDVTLADVCLVSQVYNALRFKVDMQRFPLIQKIYDNCNELEAFQKAKPEAQTDAG